MPKLVITDSDGSRTLALDREVKAGRLADNEVTLKVPEASRHHCRFFQEQASWFVEDLGSSNGTLVNGRKVSKFELQDGDLISIGAVTIRFLDSVATAEERGETAPGWGDDEISLEPEPEPVAPAARATPEPEVETDLYAETGPVAIGRSTTRMMDADSAFADPTFALSEIPEKKSPLPTIISLVLLLALAGGAAWLYMNRDRLSGDQGGAGGGTRRVASNLVPQKFASFEPLPPNELNDEGAGWHKEDAIDASSTGEVQDPVHSGDQAWSISRRSGEKDPPPTWISLSGSQECELAVTPGKVYKLSAMARLADASHAIPGVVVTWIEPAGEDVHEIAREVVPGAVVAKKWTELASFVQAPEGASRARVGLVAAGTGEVFFDDVVLDSAPDAPGRGAEVRYFRAWLTPSAAVRVFHYARPVSDGIGVWKMVEGGGFEPPWQAFVPKAGGDGVSGTLRDGGAEVGVTLAATDSTFKTTWRFGGATPGHAILIPLPGSADEINVTLLDGERAKRMRAAFQKVSACGVIVGGQGDRMRIKFLDAEGKPFTAPLDVVTDQGRAFVKLDRGDHAAVTFEYELSFDAEMNMARTLLAKADDAARAGRIGESITGYEEVLAKFPFDEGIEKQASGSLERLMNDGRNEARALGARVDDAKFFRTARLEDELFAQLETDVTRYAGTNLQPDFAAKRDELAAERKRTASEKHEAAARAAYQRGLDYINGKQPRGKLGRDILEMVVNRYPDTEWAQQAKELLDQLRQKAESR